MSIPVHQQEPEEPRKGRSNAILTYETVDDIKTTLVRVDAKLDRLDEKVDDNAKQHVNHEIRIRALELGWARQSGGQGLAQWATPILLSVIGVVFTLMNYLAK